MLIKNIAALIIEAGQPYLRGAYLVIKDGLIAEVGSGPPPPSGADRVLDADGKLVLPGFVNTHHHLCQTLTRAYPPVMDAPLFDWLRKLYPLWAKLDEEAIYLSSLVGMAELLLSGCTTTTDHHYVLTAKLKQAVDIQIEAAREIGMRFQPCRGSMSL
ncbi:MAG TPA: 8-oxoguanine deaminase, partial [Candidatus Fraserbacteria bacterium]|nr:8-oxoguanine deaminase [Candidatus Fraserbacteria bacterium]